MIPKDTLNVKISATGSGFLLMSFFSILLFGCRGKEYPCSDEAMTPVFTGFTLSEVDTFTIRKFKMNDNYHTLIDSENVFYSSETYQIPGDTIMGFGVKPIMVDYNWQIYLPAENRTIFISDIIDKKETGEYGGGFMEPVGCGCTKHVNSVMIDNKDIDRTLYLYSSLLFIKN